MRFLCVGDVVATPGMRAAERWLPDLIHRTKADFVIVNGENADDKNGISRDAAQRLRALGADVVTTGNHAFRQKNVLPFFDDTEWLLRPYNYPDASPGHGHTLTCTPKGSVLVINLMGQVNMEPCDNPFNKVDRLLSSVRADYIVVDFHAEATSEKAAMGYFLDGRATLVFGTHTHVQTADERRLPKGTFFLTDVGMTGSQDSVLGVDKNVIVRQFTTRIATPYLKPDSQPMLCAVLVDTEAGTVERIQKRKEEHL